MVNKKSFGDYIFDAFNYIFLIVLSVVCIYPLWYVIVSSFSDGNSLIMHTGILVKPLDATAIAYKYVFEDPMILKSYGNTLFVIVFGLAINITLTSIAAYVLSRKDVMIANGLMKLIVFTMFFSGGLIPNYLMVKNLHLIDNKFSLILPTAIVTYNLIILRTNFAAIPDSLEESARLDGAGDFTILFKIILPLSKAALAVMVLYYGVSHWNSWFSAMIYLRSREKYPLQLILREILLDNSTGAMTGGASVQDNMTVSESIKYAVIVVATLPILCVYPFLQKYFVKGVMIGSVKG